VGLTEDADEDDGIDALQRTVAAYMTPLARGHGADRDPALFAAVRTSLEQCAERWAGSEFVPRALAHLCASLPWMIWTISLNYSGDVAKTIEREAIEFDELVITVVLPWPQDRTLPDLR
jgi:hypothetical protein